MEEDGESHSRRVGISPSASARYGLKGEIPDGLLFRISSIDRDTANAFAHQNAFIEQLVGQIPSEVRARITGL